MEGSAEAALAARLNSSYSVGFSQVRLLSSRLAEVQTRSERLVAKRKQPNAVRTAVEHACLRDLLSRGVSVPQPLYCLDGSESVDVGGRPWALYRPVSGASVRDGDLTDRDFPPLVDAIARSDIGALRAPGDAVRRFVALLPESLDCAKQLRFGTPAERTLVAAAAHSVPAACDGLPYAIAHGDLAPGNIILTDDGHLAPIDFEWIAWAPRVFDVAHLTVATAVWRNADIRVLPPIGDAFRATMSHEERVAVTALITLFGIVYSATAARRGDAVRARNNWTLALAGAEDFPTAR